MFYFHGNPTIQTYRKISQNLPKSAFFSISHLPMAPHPFSTVAATVPRCLCRNGFAEGFQQPFVGAGHHPQQHRPQLRVLILRWRRSPSEKLGTSMDPSNKNGDLKRFDQAKPGELFRLFTKKKIDCTNRNQEKLETHHQNGDLTLPTKTGTQNWLVEGTG